MKLQASITIPPLSQSIHHQQSIMLIGSCFTEHIGNFLADGKFPVLQNPHGILFDPVSVCHSLLSYIQQHTYTESDLFYLNETWNSWAHHSRFSHPDKATCLQNINASQAQAAAFLKKADWLIITLGSSYSYRLQQPPGTAVANCHKAPSQSFNKHLCTIEETVTALDSVLYQLFRYNPTIQVLFTISPVRHLRDGLVENNRSKARLIEAVHHLVQKFNKLHYFPAYELVVDVLRDYRFYDIDLAHPNYLATQYVMDEFTKYAMQPATIALLEEIKQLNIAKKHRSSHPTSQLHQRFLASQFAKTQSLQKQHPYINFSEELEYFGSHQIGE